MVSEKWHWKQEHSVTVVSIPSNLGLVVPYFVYPIEYGRYSKVPGKVQYLAILHDVFLAYLASLRL